MLTPQVIVATFVVAQFCDGVLTYVALRSFGLHAEGNPLLVTWVALVGPEPAIIGAKLLACGCGVLLYSARRHGVLGGLTLVYCAVTIAWLIVFRSV